LFAAVLDTCTLWPSLRRDVLLSFAAEGIYRPLWSTTILEELEATEIEKLENKGVSSEHAQLRALRLIANMRHAFDDSEIPEPSYAPLEGSFGLPDPDDEHVVAAAIVGGAGVIVTENIKHFPADRLPYGITVIDPNDFLFDAVQIDLLAAARGIQRIAQRSGRLGPQLTFDDVLQELKSRYGMDDSVALLEVGPRP
jgi:PIN domain